MSIAALPDVPQFGLCVLWNKLRCTPWHRIWCTSKKLTVFQGCRTRCTSLAAFHRASHHWCSVTACAASTGKIRDCKFATAVFSLRLWVTRALQYETPPVSQRQEPPCLDSVGSPRNSDEINDLVPVTADEDEQGKIRVQSAVIKQSAANFAPPPPKIVKRMVCGVILAAELGPSGWTHADTSSFGSIAG